MSEAARSPTEDHGDDDDVPLGASSVGAAVEVLEEGRAGGVPVEELLGLRTRGWAVGVDEEGGEVEVLHVRFDRHRVDSQSAGDGVGDGPMGDAFLSDGVQDRPRWRGLGGEGEELADVAAVGGRPAVRTVAVAVAKIPAAGVTSEESMSLADITAP